METVNKTNKWSPVCKYDSGWNPAPVIFGQMVILINGFVPHLSGLILKNSDYGLSWIMQKGPAHKHLSVSFLCPANDIHAKSHSAISLLTAGKCN